MTDLPHKEADIARRTRAIGLARGLSPPQIAGEIHARCSPLFGTSQVKSHRLAYGIALSDVVAQIKALYEAEGRHIPKLGETLLSAYESGVKRPGPEYLHYLCTAYRVEPDALGFAGPCVCGRAHTMRPTTGALPASSTGDAGSGTGVLTGAVVVPGPDDGVWTRDPSRAYRDARLQTRAADPMPTNAGEEDNVFRRTLLQLLAGAGVSLDGQILGAADVARRRMDDALVRTSVSPTMLDQWEEATAGYGREYMSTPPLRLLCDVLLDFSEVRQMCDRRQPIELQERLCRVTTRLSGLAGIVMFDLGDHRLSRAFFRTARTAADETGDRHMRAWVAVREALVPLYYGDPDEGLHLARRAQGLAGRVPSVAGAMGPVLEARALAQLARRGATDANDGALRALARGRAVFSRMSAHDQADAAFGYTERQMEFYEGNVHTNLGESRRADEALSRALALYAGSERLDRTLIRLDRATCRLHEGEPEEALRACLQAIEDLPAEHRTDIVLQRARQLETTAVARFGELPAARDLREVLGRRVA
jgi:hypothetical protein